MAYEQRNLQNRYRNFRRNTDIDNINAQPPTNNRHTLADNLAYRLDQLDDFEEKMYGDLRDFGYENYAVMHGGDEDTYESNYLEPMLKALEPALNRFTTAKKEELKAQHAQAALLHLRHVIRRKQADPSTSLGRRHQLREFNDLVGPPGAHLPSLNNVPLRQRLAIHAREIDTMPLTKRVRRR